MSVNWKTFSFTDFFSKYLRWFRIFCSIWDECISNEDSQSFILWYRLNVNFIEIDDLEKNPTQCLSARLVRYFMTEDENANFKRQNRVFRGSLMSREFTTWIEVFTKGDRTCSHGKYARWHFSVGKHKMRGLSAYKRLACDSIHISAENWMAFIKCLYRVLMLSFHMILTVKPFEWSLNQHIHVIYCWRWP